MTVRIYNTLTRSLDELKGRGLDPRHLNMYVCGPTVYDSPHLGHARSYVFFDTLRRVLLLDSYSVYYFQNFSDVDEKIDVRASMENVIPSVISERYKEEFLQDMDELNIMRSDAYMNASHIKEFMHTVTRILMEKGMCYRGGENIYFHASAGGGFGSLLHDKLDNLISGNEADSFRFEKKDKEDFVIWLGNFNPDSYSDSTGKPAWNLECFSIVHKQVGCELDIQGGGLDLIFPHHEVSSVLSKSYCSLEFANYYIHNAFVTSKMDKMSKSTRNYVGTRELLREFGPDAIRMYLLSAHFRQNIEYDERQLAKWKKVADDVTESLRRRGVLETGRAVHAGIPAPAESARARFIGFMQDNMHTEKAVELFVRHALQKETDGAVRDDLRFMSAALGLFGFVPTARGAQNTS